MRSISANYPEVPLLYSIPGDLQHNSKIEIIGQMLHRNRFRVDLKTGSKVPVGIHDDTNDDVIFHLSIRPFCNEIVRNHMTQGRWGHEEREGGCPIQYGSQFNMLILIEDDKFKVTINNLQFCEFKHRLRLSLAKFLYISGEIRSNHLDGSYLAEFLLNKGYTVHGIIRRSSSFNTGRIAHLYADPSSHQGGKMTLHYGDMTDSSSLVKVIAAARPTEIYNLAAQSHVKVSFELSEYTAEVDAVGTYRLLDAIRTCGLEKQVKFYQASTSELYGKVAETPQTEKTPFYPRSPYACAKICAYWVVINYREAYQMFACNGILFNHESPRRGENFVTRKITRSIAKIFLNQMDCFELGNLDSKRDWGHAKDYVEAMWLMLQQKEPQDFVVATGETHSVREFVETAFDVIGRKIVWRGEGVNELGIEAGTDIVRVKINPKYFRPTEVDLLLGDPSKAQRELGWKRKVSFLQLVEDMISSDIKLMRTNPHA